MSDEQTTRRVTQLIAVCITRSAAADEGRATEVAPERVAEWMTGSEIKRRIAAYLLADGVTADQVAQRGALGVAIGPMTLAPPVDATYAQLEAYRDTLRAIFDTVVPRINDTHAAMRAKRSTLDTVQLEEEDLQPDPLTATPAESTGAHRAVTGEQDVQGREDVGHRVVVFRADGSRSRGVLEAVTPTELLLVEPCEDGDARIPHDQVVEVVRLAAPAAEAPFVNRLATGRDPEEPRAAYPTEPATGPMPDRESLDSGPHRILILPAPAPVPEPERAPVPAAQLTVPDAVPDLPVDLPQTAPSLFRRLRDLFVPAAAQGGDRG